MLVTTCSQYIKLSQCRVIVGQPHGSIVTFSLRIENDGMCILHVCGLSKDDVLALSNSLKFAVQDFEMKSEMVSLHEDVQPAKA